MSKTDEELESIKVVIRSLLIVEKRDLTLEKFIGLYKENEGKNFPFEHFGFSDSISFLQSIPDTVNVVQSGRDVYVRATPTDEVEHVRELVVGQKHRGQKDRVRRRRRAPRKHKTKTEQPPVPKVQPADIPLKETAYSCRAAGTPELRVEDEEDEEDWELEVMDMPVHTNGVLATLPMGTNGYQTSENGLNPQLEEDIKQVLLKNSSGIWLSDFATLYQEVIGRKLALSEYGFRNIMELMEKCTDLLYITRPCAEKDFMVCPHSLSEPLNTKMVAALELILRSSGSQGMTVDELLEAYQKKTGILIQLSDLGFTQQKFVTFLTRDMHVTYESVREGQFVLKWSDDFKEAEPCSISAAACEDIAFQRALAESKDPFECFSSPPLDLPKNPFELQKGLSKKKYCAVHVSQIYEVDHFYVQLKGPATSLLLDDLMAHMEMYSYSGPKDEIPENEVCVGMPCAAPYTYSDNTSDWHRGLVVAVSTYFPRCQVYYVDFGTLRVLPKKELRYLRDEFFDLPAQAIRVSMAHLVPTSPSGWTPESKAFFINVATGGHPLMCKVLKKEGPVYDVTLCDTCTVPEVHISDSLVDNNYARLCFKRAAGTEYTGTCSSILRAKGTRSTSPKPVLPKHLLPNVTQPGICVSGADSAESDHQMPFSETDEAAQSTRKGKRASHGEATKQSTCEATKRSEVTKQNWSWLTDCCKEQPLKTSHAEKTGQMAERDNSELVKRGCSMSSSQAIEQGSTSRHILATKTPQKDTVNGQARRADSLTGSGKAHCSPNQAETPDRLHTPSPTLSQCITKVPMQNYTNEHKGGCQPIANNRVWFENCFQLTGQSKVTTDIQSVPMAQALAVPPACQIGPTSVEPFVGSIVPSASPSASPSALQNYLPVSSTSRMLSFGESFTEQLKRTVHAALQSDTSSGTTALSAGATASATGSQWPEGAQDQATSGLSNQDEDFMVILQRELDGPLPLCCVKPEYLKTGHCLMVLNHLQKAYVSTTNVCDILNWTSNDILEKLEQKRIDFPFLVLTRSQNRPLFNQLFSYDVPGVKIHSPQNVQELSEQVTFVPLSSVIDLLNLFECQSKALRQEVARVMNSFDPTNEYWLRTCYDSETEDSSLHDELARLHQRRQELHRKMIATAVDKKIVDELCQIEEKIGRSQVLIAREGAQLSQPSFTMSKKSKRRTHV